MKNQPGTEIAEPESSIKHAVFETWMYCDSGE